MAKQFAIRLSLIMFTVSVIEAVVAGDAFHAGITAAGMKAFWFFGIGWVIGEIARRVVEENANAEFANVEAGLPAANNKQ